MSMPNNNIQDPDLVRVYSALQRAAQAARKIAKETNTPLVIYENGQIVMQHDEEDLTTAPGTGTPKSPLNPNQHSGAHT